MSLCGREPIAIDREVPEGLDGLQLSETIPSVTIDYIKKAIKAKSEEDWSALEAEDVSRERCRTTHTNSRS